jgi:hypothetical protein
LSIYIWFLPIYTVVVTLIDIGTESTSEDELDYSIHQLQSSPFCLFAVSPTSWKFRLDFETLSLATPLRSSVTGTVGAGTCTTGALLFTGASLPQLLYQCQTFTTSLPVPAFHNLFTSASLSQSLYLCWPFTISLPVPAFHNLFTSASLSQSLLTSANFSQSLYHCQPFTISSPVPAFHKIFTSASLSQNLYQCQAF